MESYRIQGLVHLKKLSIYHLVVSVFKRAMKAASIFIRLKILKGNRPEIVKLHE